MRMRDQLIVIVAVTVATVAVAGNVLAQTRAANQRIALEQAGLAAAWSYPLMDATTSQQPADSESAPARRHAEEVDGTDSAGQSETPDDPAIPCSGQRQCASGDETARGYVNHGRTVSAYVHSLGFEEGVDGPRGAYVRQIARPDIENDGPPRSERAEENQDKKDETAPPGQDKKDETAPPGQDKKDETAPPGQDKKDEDD